ncbi:MAG: hypothetical protein PHH23_01755 [Paludibacteraceae bacterium]|nr:hypothetical protein [Paludibacteraceae bacterium]
MNISLNGANITTFGLTMLKGSLDNLLKPAEMKPLVLNENSSIDGSIAITSSRKVKARDVSVSFLVNANSRLLLSQRIDSLIQSLINGDMDEYSNYTGVNSLSINDIRKIFRLVYLRFDKYAGFGANSATVSIQFKELNPNDR